MKFVKSNGKPVFVNLALVDVIEVVSGYGGYYVRANVSDNRWYHLYQGTEDECIQYLDKLALDLAQAGAVLMDDIAFYTATYADLRRRYVAAEEAGEPVIKLWDQMQAALAALQEAKKNALPCG